MPSKDPDDRTKRLRDAVLYLYDERHYNLSSAKLLKQATAYYQTLRDQGKIAFVPRFSHHTNLDKFREDPNRSLRHGADELWDFIEEHYPRALGLEKQTEAGLINSLFWYYQVDWRKHAALSAEIEDSTFTVYHFTEMLAETHPDAVVVGEITVKRQGPRLMHVTERQAYDGDLGLDAATEDNEGYCFPKFQSVCMLLRGPKMAPKFYVFHKYRHAGNPAKISWMRGHMVRITPDGPLFMSPAYAVRKRADHPPPNIYLSDSPKIGSSVMAQLRRDPA